MQERKYPVGIQTFSEIRKGNYVYVDKTDLVWKLAHDAKYIFLSRPRRFGKSLLSTTLDSYFQGRKDLFEGLKIMEMEEEWENYPVIHIDLSVTKAETTVEGLRTVLLRILEPYKAIYGEGIYESSPGGLFSGIIHRAFEKSGKQVAVIIDEYDAPLLDKLHKREQLDQSRNVMQEFFVQLKANEAMIRFCFITGITKFSQLSIFSTINNLTNISLDPSYSAICGFTNDELLSVFDSDIQMLADRYHCPKEEMIGKLKLQYDGYHFGEDLQDIYNPHSLISAFKLKKLDCYWFASGTPSFLFEEMKRFNTNLLDLQDLQVPSSQFDVPTEAMTSALPMLYQAGYLTIKGFDFDTTRYTLDFPNAEVKVGFMENFLTYMMGILNSDTRGFAGDIYAALLKHDTESAMRHIQSFFASIPYLEFGEKELDEITKYEAYYEVLTYVVFSVFNYRTFTQVKVARGRTDLVVFMNDATYVMELKMHGTAEEALRQIESKDYAIPYRTIGKPVVKIGIAFSKETKTISEWKIVNE
jgi:hypothetical protein